MSSEPTRHVPEKKWQHFDLYNNVREVIFSLPSRFSTATNIEGISVTDIFTLGSALGATIESQVVDALNGLRDTWDSAGNYRHYSFIRQAQTFPDVLLTKMTDSENAPYENIILGIELKSWYLLAKEGEPSFRFQVTPSACAVPDLVVVVPWALSKVISGSPCIFMPYIESAKYAAEYRNFWWETQRDSKTDSKITSPTGISPYPKKSDHISDRPASDQGNNFGRFSRSGIMDHYIKQVHSQSLCGIRADHWRDFFKLFHDQANHDEIRTKIEQLKKKFSSNMVVSEPNSFFDELLQLFDRYSK
jgi:hypothetical protein